MPCGRRQVENFNRAMSAKSTGRLSRFFGGGSGRTSPSPVTPQTAPALTLNEMLVHQQVRPPAALESACSSYLACHHPDLPARNACHPHESATTMCTAQSKKSNAMLSIREEPTLPVVQLTLSGRDKARSLIKPLHFVGRHPDVAAEAEHRQHGARRQDVRRRPEVHGARRPGGRDRPAAPGDRRQAAAPGHSPPRAQRRALHAGKPCFALAPIQHAQHMLAKLAADRYQCKKAGS